MWSLTGASVLLSQHSANRVTRISSMNGSNKERKKRHSVFLSSPDRHCQVSTLHQSERMKQWPTPEVTFQADLHILPDTRRTRSSLLNLAASQYSRNIGFHPHIHLLQGWRMEDGNFSVKSTKFISLLHY